MRAKLAVIIPTADRPISLGECLRSLAGSCCPVARVVVVDASSKTDAQAQVVRPPQDAWPFQLEYLKADAPGAARQRNLALARLQDEEAVLFMDDDAVVEPDCIGEMLEGFAQGGDHVIGIAANIHNQPIKTPSHVTRIMLGLVGGRFYGNVSGRLIGPAVGILPDDRVKERFLPIEWARGGCMLYRRRAIPEGGFRAFFEGYSLGEDLAFSVDAQRKGKGVLWYASRARVIHTPGPSTHPSLSEYGRMEVLNRWYLMREVLGKRDMSDAVRFWVWIGWEAVASFRATLCKGQWEKLIENWKGRCTAIRDILKQA